MENRRNLQERGKNKTALKVLIHTTRLLFSASTNNKERMMQEAIKDQKNNETHMMKKTTNNTQKGTTKSTTTMSTTTTTKGVTMKWMPPRVYDLIVRLFTCGREESMRREMLVDGIIQPGDSVLDVGCGTGTLTLLAAEYCAFTGTVDVPSTCSTKSSASGLQRILGGGSVVGIDPNESFIKRAKTKLQSKKKFPIKGCDINFVHGMAETLPFDDNTFDVVLCTFVFHHLPDDNLQRQCLHEIHRVLKPGGKMLLVDIPSHHQHEDDHHHSSNSNHHHNNRRRVHHFQGCCGASDVQESNDEDDGLLFQTDPIIKMIRNDENNSSRLVDVHVRRVRMLSGMAITATKRD